VVSSNDDWVWGGAARVGATYAIGPRWFLDFAYTFARSEEFKIKERGELFQQQRPAHEQRSRLPQHPRADHQPIRSADAQSPVLR
jgi:hypothetical protein